MHSLIRRLRQVIRLETKSIILWMSETLANGDLTAPKSDSILMSERSCTACSSLSETIPLSLNYSFCERICQLHKRRMSERAE